MSELNDDKKVLDKPRKKLDIEKAPLRDQIPKKLAKKLKEMEIGHKVANLWSTGNNNRAERLKQLTNFLKDWDDFITPIDEGPFAQSSHLHLPISFTIVKTYHARFFQAWKNNPAFAKARRPDSAERASMVSEVMRYAEQDWANNNLGIEAVIDTWLWNWCAYGAGTKKWRWDVSFDKWVDVVETEEPAIIEEESEETGVILAKRGMRRQEREIEKVEKTFEGPVCDVIPEEDILLIGGNGDPESADAVLHQQWLTASDLWTLADRGIFDEDSIKKVIQSGPDSETQDNSTDFKQTQAERGGQAALDTDADLDRYRIIESYLKLDVDNSGINSKVIAWVHPKSGEVLRATFLRRVNKAGTLPFQRIEFHRRPETDSPIGLVELLFPVSTEIDAIHNMRIDFGLISTMPFGFYRASSSLNPEIIQYEPGSLIPLDDPQRDVHFPNLGNRTFFGVQEEQALQNLVERLTGISDISLGVQSGTQGAARTATGTRALVSEANANLDIHLKRMQLGIKRSRRYLLAMLQQRIPVGLSFRIIGDDGKDYWVQVQAREDLAGEFDFEIDPSSSDSNPAVREQKSLEVLNMVLNPLVIQLGVATPLKIFEALKNRMQALGIMDWSRFLEVPSDREQVLTPEEELNRIVRGIPVPVSLRADHEGFLNLFQEVISKDELLGQFDEQATVRLAQQARQHQQVLQALQQQQAQQQNLRQQQINAGTSQTQAPPGLGPLSEAG